MTYENAQEAEFMQSLWRPGAPLENTIFAFLDPNGRALTRGARAPDGFFRSPSEMAQYLSRLSSEYPAHNSPQTLPAVETIRLGLNVAACDKLPLAIVVGDSRSLSQLEARLAPLAWRSDFTGAMTYAAGGRSELGAVSGANLSTGYLFVLPDQFGVTGQLLAQLPATASASELERAMKSTIAFSHPKIVDHREHIRQGRMQGISWQSLLPVTDPATLFHDQMERERGGPPSGYRPGPGRAPGPSPVQGWGGNNGESQRAKVIRYW